MITIEEYLVKLNSLIADEIFLVIEKVEFTHIVILQELEIVTIEWGIKTCGNQFMFIQKNLLPNMSMNLVYFTVVVILLKLNKENGL